MFRKRMNVKNNDEVNKQELIEPQYNNQSKILPHSTIPIILNRIKFKDN